MIYVADRLLDAIRSGPSLGTARHLFYRRHWSAFLRIAVPASLGLAIACRFLNERVLQNGILTVALVGIYLLAVHAAPARVRKSWPKELAVGLIFSLGTFLAAWTKMPSASRSLLIAPAVTFAILCWHNCVLIECWEWKRFRKISTPTPHPLTIWMGSRFTTVGFAVASVCLLELFFGALYPFVAASVLSLFALIWLNNRSPHLAIDALRVLADVALLTPVLLMFVPAS